MTLALFILGGLFIGIQLGNVGGWLIVRIKGSEYANFPFNWRIFTGPRYIDWCYDMHPKRRQPW